MPRGLPAALALAAALGLYACAASRTCPCGEQFERDPFEPEAAFFVGADHAVEDHCLCRCGSDPVLRMPPSLTCDGFEGPCERADGGLAQLRCE